MLQLNGSDPTIVEESYVRASVSSECRWLHFCFGALGFMVIIPESLPMNRSLEKLFARGQVATFLLAHLCIFLVLFVNQWLY